MKFIDKKSVRRYQQGGPMPVETAAPAPAQEAQDPMMMIVEAAMQAVQAQDPNLAMEVCMMLVELVQGGPAPVGEVPAGQPVFKNGGRIVRRVK